MADGNHKPRETAKAAAAFADYVALGPTRSLAKLAAQYVQENRYKTEITAFNILGHWSGLYAWQARLKAIAESHLAEATELRRSTYVTILREYQRRYGDPDMASAAKTHELHGVYDRVKPEEPKPIHVSGPDGGPLTVEITVVPSRQAGVD